MTSRRHAIVLKLTDDTELSHCQKAKPPIYVSIYIKVCRLWRLALQSLLFSLKYFSPLGVSFSRLSCWVNFQKVFLTILKQQVPICYWKLKLYYFVMGAGFLTC